MLKLYLILQYTIIILIIILFLIILFKLNEWIKEIKYQDYCDYLMQQYYWEKFFNEL